jgi:hypothetical protein
LRGNGNLVQHIRACATNAECRGNLCVNIRQLDTVVSIRDPSGGLPLASSVFIVLGETISRDMGGGTLPDQDCSNLALLQIQFQLSQNHSQHVHRSILSLDSTAWNGGIFTEIEHTVSNDEPTTPTKETSSIEHKMPSQLTQESFATVHLSPRTHCFEIGAEKLTDAIDPHNQMKLETHLGRNPPLGDRSLTPPSSSFEGMHHTTEFC